jgi:hypothetical protein
MTADVPISTPAPAVQTVRYGLIDVAVMIQLQSCPGGATAVARSGLNPDGSRGIRIWLNPEHLMISRSLSRSDSLTIRFLVALSLTEYCDFWRSSSDGRAVKRALIRLAGIERGEHPYGSGFASRLAACEALRVVDSLPIFAKNPPVGPFDLFSLR